METVPGAGLLQAYSPYLSAGHLHGFAASVEAVMYAADQGYYGETHS
jgi:hypothetical protein